MSNAFAGWNQARVEEHNARVAARRRHADHALSEPVVPAQPAAEIVQPKKKRIRQSEKPLLNKLETEFLDWFKNRNKDHAIYTQAFKFRIANGAWYTVDFLSIDPSGQVWAWEVKGRHAWEDALLKLRVAATTYREIKWHLCWKDNNWQIQKVLS